MRLNIRALRFSIFAFVLCTTAQAQWSRTVSTGKGESSDTPEPHPIGYFIANPLLRDDGDDLCTVCTPEGKAHGTTRLSTKLVRVGALAGFSVWDLFYTGKDVLWKSVLVQSGKSFTEIYHLQTSGVVGPLKASQVVRVGSESVLATEIPTGGNGGNCWERYWWFDTSGPHSIDFSVMRPAIAKHLPAGAYFSTGCGELHLADQQIEGAVQAADAKCHACGWIGNVTANFTLEGARVVPGKIDFNRSTQ